MAIWLTQWLCPARHCAFALAWDEAVVSRADVELSGKVEAARMGIRPWCGIDREPLHFEHTRTIFMDIDEASGWLALYQLAQLQTREVLWKRGIAQEPPPWIAQEPPP